MTVPTPVLGVVGGFSVLRRPFQSYFLSRHITNPKRLKRRFIQPNIYQNEKTEISVGDCTVQ